MIFASHLGDFRSDLIESPIGTLVGKTRLTGMIDSATVYIKTNAEAGARQAIPDIQKQARAAVLPFVLGAAGAGLLGLAFGIVALVKLKRRG